MFTSIAGRSVIVTGASKGIGKGIARVFAKAGGTAAAHSADVRKWEDMERMAAAAEKAHGGIDILCANAGIFPAAKLTEMTAEKWDEVLATNLKGTFLAVKACLPAMKKKGKGRIIVTSSITGPVTGYPGWTHYGASKAGQLGFLRTAAIELAPSKITINAVMPGNIRTEGLEGLGPDYEKKMTESVPLRRLGTVEDIGYGALYFASDEAGYVTGQTLIIDGGQILPESLAALEEMGN